jgi:hypothetical protein
MLCAVAEGQLQQMGMIKKMIAAMEYRLIEISSSSRPA